MKRTLFKLLVLIAFSMPYGPQAQTTERFIQLKPQRCVALHKGQTCYQTVSISLQSRDAEPYCLFSAQHEMPLHCWQNDETETVQYQFASAEALAFYVKPKDRDDIVASSLFEVVWVYRSRKTNNSSWRLF